MYKKIIVLFLLLGTSVIFLPATGKAADINNTTNTVSSATPGSPALIPQRNRRRWRNKRWQMRSKRWNRRDNRRDDRRDDRRNNRRNRRDDRRN